MKHTFLLCIFLMLGGYAQNLNAQSINLNESSVSTTSGELQSSNAKLLKDLRKLKKKGKRTLAKQYPDASEAELDSLIKQQIGEIKENFKDSTESAFGSLRQKLSEDLKETPEKLPVSDEVQESIETLKELEAISKLKKDSLKAKDIFTPSNIKKVNKRAGDVLDNFGKYKSEFKDFDEVMLSKVESLPEAQLMKDQLEKIKAYKPLPEGYRKNMDRLQTNDFVKDKLEEKAKELEKVGESLQERFDEAMAKMQEAKAEFPSLESLEDAPKRYNPYKGLPLFQRLQFGGNLNYNPEKPVSIDLAGNIVYPVNKRLSLGVESAGRIQLEKSNKVASSNQQGRQQVWSLRGLSRYFITPNFFFQANYEASKVNTENLDNSISYNWYRTGLVGIGKQFNVRKGIKMNVSIFYDVFYNPVTSPHGKAWIARLGFEL
ncbi:hypothetical protein [Roseivirga sp.]|uniref:hypothetical protein n=1 Tax=Roseivirga sp. TaxID=1964215 RepID=UPI003B51898A